MKNLNRSNSKPVAAVATHRDAATLQTEHNSTFQVVYPTTPVARQMFFNFISSNHILTRLADAMVWGNITAEQYSAISKAFSDSLAAVEQSVKAARKVIDELDKARRGKHQAQAKTVKPTPQTQKPKQLGQQKGKQVQPIEELAAVTTTPVKAIKTLDISLTPDGNNGSTTPIPLPSKTKARVEVVG